MDKKDIEKIVVFGAIGIMLVIVMINNNSNSNSNRKDTANPSPSSQPIGWNMFDATAQEISDGKYSSGGGDWWGVDNADNAEYSSAAKGGGWLKKLNAAVQKSSGGNNFMYEKGGELVDTWHNDMLAGECGGGGPQEWCVERGNRDERRWRRHSGWGDGGGGMSSTSNGGKARN